MGSEPDSEVWEYAKTDGFILVSKDSDFHDKSTSFGYPSKVIWIRRGNCSNRQIELLLLLLLRNKVDIIKSFNDDTELSIIEFNQAIVGGVISF